MSACLYKEEGKRWRRNKVYYHQLSVLLFTFLVLCGLVYPLIVTGIAQAVMKDNADGSLIYNDKNEVIGSKLIGQNFTDPRYFQGRVSSIEYKAEASGSNNYAPSNPDLAKRVEKSIADWKEKIQLFQLQKYR